MTISDYQPLFNPKTIAVIGASSDPMKFGGRSYVSAMARCGDEKIFAVNPNITEIDGKKSYARIQDIGDDIDHALVTVPAPFVVQAIADCAEKGVRAVEILTAGFSETGVPEGSQWEKQIVDIAKKNGVRIVGPNCFGIYSPESPLTILPGPDYSKESGPLGVIAQSGGFTSFMVRKVLELGVRISKAISYGNACDLNEIDFLSYLRDDEQTKIVAAYIEGLKQGRQFLELVRETSLKKPVIIWKGGLTDQGSRAVASHTGSLGGNKQIWESLFHQTGAIPVVGISEMIDLIVGLHCVPDFRCKRVSIVGGGGAITVAAADALEMEGIKILPFSDRTQRLIRAHLPPHGNSAKNPVDMGSPMFFPKTLTPILEAVAESDMVDAVIVEQMIFNLRGQFDTALAEVIPSVSKASGKPFIVSLPETSSGSQKAEVEVEQARRKYREWYISHSIPVFDTLQQTANALGKILRYNEFIERYKSE